jgi:PilZ domain
MDPHTTAPVITVAEHPGQSDRRHGVRTPTILSLLYSGMDSGQMLMGDGVVTDLSSSGIGISGDRSVTPGMEVALFVDLPGVEEPLCIAQGRVSWVEGRRFGVELGTLKLEEKNHLGFFLWDCVTHSGRNGSI